MKERNLGFYKKKRERLLDSKVYILTGRDIEAILKDMGRDDLTKSLGNLERIIDYISKGLNNSIPWMEYMEVVLDNYLDEEKEIKDMIYSLVDNYYGEPENKEFYEEVCEDIFKGYSHHRIKKAVELGYDLGDLDEWELTCKLYDKGQLKEIIEAIGLKLSKPLGSILLDGEFFMKEIFGPIWDKATISMADLFTLDKGQLLELKKVMKEE